jgi:ketosteroid isomerase-like protein
MARLLFASAPLPGRQEDSTMAQEWSNYSKGRTLLSIGLAAFLAPVIDSAHQSSPGSIRPTFVSKGGIMSRNAIAFLISIFVISLIAGMAVTRAQTSGKADAVAAITKIENDSVKADLAADGAFYQKLLADDWTGGDSGGTWFTKPDILRMTADTKNNKTNSEKISELKVRVYGDTALATYKDSYDALINGEHRVRTIIAPDTFVKIGGEWKQVASHSSVAK